MRAVVLDGAREDGPPGELIREILVEEISQAEGKAEVFVLRREEIGFCRGCFGCWTKSPGTCRVDDRGREIAERVLRSDLMVFLTPITFGGYSSELKKAVDRLVPLINPLFLRVAGEEGLRPGGKEPPRLLGLGWLPAPNEECGRLFQALVRRNAANAHLTGYAAWTFVVGEPPESLRSVVRGLLEKTGVV